MPTDLGNLSDADLLTMLQQHVASVIVLPLTFGLTVPEATSIQMLTQAFANALNAWHAIQIQYDNVLLQKNLARNNALNELRIQRNQIRNDRDVTAASKGSVGLLPADDEPTPSPTPSSVPLARVEYGKLRHTIYFRDASNANSEAKPKGMRGCEIWRHVGPTAPTTEADFEFVALDTASPYVAFYEMADATQRAFYRLRWLSKNGDTGEWSETVETTING